MKKILLTSFEYPTGKTYCGGVGQIVKQNRKVLVELGHEVFVLISAGFYKKLPLRTLNPDGSVTRYPNLYSFLKEHPWGSFDYIIQHFVNWTKDFARFKHQRNGKPKIIYHFHSILRREKDSGFKIFNFLLHNQERMIELADRIICPSQYEYDNFVRYFPHFSEKIFVVENTIESFHPRTQDMQSIREKYKLQKRDVVSIYVGRLEHIKGAHIIVKHLPQLLKKYTNLKVFVIGKSIDASLFMRLKFIQRKFPKQLHYLKHLEKNTLFQYYYLSDIFINSSLSESFSLATHEGALCKNALLLNSLPVFDKFKSASLSFSYQDGNGHGFVSQYERLIKNKSLRARYAKKAQKVAQDFFDKNRLKEEMKLLLQ